MSRKKGTIKYRWEAFVEFSALGILLWLCIAHPLDFETNLYGVATVICALVFITTSAKLSNMKWYETREAAARFAHLENKEDAWGAIKVFTGGLYIPLLGISLQRLFTWTFG